jgi:hypothetical protein
MTTQAAVVTGADYCWALRDRPQAAARQPRCSCNHCGGVAQPLRRFAQVRGRAHASHLIRRATSAPAAPSCTRALSPLWQLLERFARVWAAADLPAEGRQSICHSHGGALVPCVPYARRSALCHGHRACKRTRVLGRRRCSVLLAGAVAAGWHGCWHHPVSSGIACGMCWHLPQHSGHSPWWRVSREMSGITTPSLQPAIANRVEFLNGSADTNGCFAGACCGHVAVHYWRCRALAHAHVRCTASNAMHFFLQGLYACRDGNKERR